MIDIAVMHICVPIMNADIEDRAKMHVRLFLISKAIEIIDAVKIPWPIACCRAAKSRSFLIM